MPEPLSHDAFAFVRASSGIVEYRHRQNGLTVLLLPEAAAPVATVMVTYRVGSRNEGAGLTGATHLLEHLMFKGTERFNRDDGTSIFATLQRVGAQMNATTWYDRTNYYALLPKEHLPLAVEIEADRMRGARVRDEDLASERTVVLNELDRGENEPLRKLLHAVFATAYFAHPYGHPVIGWRSDVETVTAEGLRHFYDTYYWPSNATVSVIGRFEPDAALDQIHEAFGAIPAGPEIAPDAPEPLTHRDAVTQEPPQIGERRVIVRQAGQLGTVMLAWKAPAGLDADADALDVLAQILAGGKSARLFRRLTDQGLATHTSAFFPRLRDPSLFVLYAALTPETTHAEAEAALREVATEVARDGVTEGELARARRQVVAEEAFGRDGPFAVASRLNEAIAVGDWTLYTEYRPRIEAVTLEAVRAAAARIVSDDHLTVGWYVPTHGDANGEDA
ncbi:MAG: insulinase family protein [Rhodothermaceae bacterium]|nr:insulinase family protein [Rhodothermaceae bacterium]